MENKNIYDEIFDKPCSICKKIIKKDIYNQGNCPYCKWKNSFLADENPDNVIYPNLISLNKARKLYSEGKPFEPDLNDFVEALFFYSEMQFEYKQIYYAVELVGNDEDNYNIELYNSKTGESFFFKTKEDFVNNAKIEGEFLKDVWNETTDRYWLQ